MSGQSGANSPHENYVLMHGPGTVRSGKWKFYPWREGKGGRRDAPKGKPSDFPVQLYDTVSDIGETKNLAAGYPDVIKRPTVTMIRPKGALSANRPAKPRKPGKK